MLGACCDPCYVNKTKGIDSPHSEFCEHREWLQVHYPHYLIDAEKACPKRACGASNMWRGKKHSSGEEQYNCRNSYCDGVRDIDSVEGSVGD